MKQIRHLIESYKPNYRIIAKSKRFPHIDWYVVDGVFDEVNRNRYILKVTNELKSQRSNPAQMIIDTLRHFNQSLPIFAYFKDKVVTLPITDVRIDDGKKVVVLWVE
jgi:hypothetical protein